MGVGGNPPEPCGYLRPFSFAVDLREAQIRRRQPHDANLLTRASEHAQLSHATNAMAIPGSLRLSLTTSWLSLAGRAQHWALQSMG